MAADQNKKTRIEDICVKVTSGGTPSRKNPEFYTGSIPWIKTGELNGWFINDTGERITDEAIAKSSAKIYPKNTVLMAMYGDGRTIGSVGITNVEAASNQASCAMIADTEKCCPLYLLYSLQHHRDAIVKLALGGAQRNLNQGTIKNYELIVPDLHEQKNIADILSTYDYLIENNNRRIAILEEMAQSLYREWFVKFRFPSHENTKFIDSTQGKITEGWEVKKLKDVCHLTMGQSPKSEFYNENGDGLPFFQGVKDFGQRFPTVRIWCSKPTRLAEAGDVLFSVRAPVGRLNLADQKVAIGRGLCAIRHTNGMQSFLFQQLKSIFTSEDMIGNGAIFASVTKKDMEDIKLITPENRYVVEFCSNADPIFDQLDKLSKKNDVLKSQRDLLLPKLISGSISIEQ